MKLLFIRLLLILTPFFLVQAIPNSYTFSNSMFGLIETDTTKPKTGDSSTTINKLDHINDVMEKIVVYSPFPVVSYSTETDWLF